MPSMTKITTEPTRYGKKFLSQNARENLFPAASAGKRPDGGKGLQPVVMGSAGKYVTSCKRGKTSKRWKSGESGRWW